jgi:hypothetical protein
VVAAKRSCSCTSKTFERKRFYAAAGYRPDGSDRISEFRGTRIREVRLVKQLAPT